MAVNNLVTLEEVKNYLRITNETDDGLLLRLIAAATAFLLSRMNRREGLDHDYRFTRGLPEVPADIAFVCMEIVGLRFKERERIGEKSKAIGQQTVSYSLNDVSAYGRAVIDAYKRVTP